MQRAFANSAPRFGEPESEDRHFRRRKGVGPKSEEVIGDPHRLLQPVGLAYSEDRCSEYLNVGLLTRSLIRRLTANEDD